MNRVVVACVGLLALAGGSATAADLPRYYQPGPAYNPIYTWTGFYGGINGGYAWSGDQTIAITPGDPFIQFVTCGGGGGGTCAQPASSKLRGGSASPSAGSRPTRR